MKKLILCALVGISAVNQMHPMLYRKSPIQELVPVFQEDMTDGQWSLRVTQEPLLPELEELEGQARKEKIKAWCDEFKKNSKKPAMWQKPEEVKTRDIEKVESCHFVGKDKAQNIINALSVEIINLNEKKTSPTKSDFEFLDRIQDIQKNEWDKWQINGQDVAGMRVAYKEEEKPAQDEKQSPARIFLHSVNNVRYFVTFNKSPYYKKIKESYSNTLAHELENSAYHYALQSLQLTEEALKRDLHNQSYFQRLWNYRKRQNTHETLALIKNEIALFKNQDAIDEAKDGKPYLKKEEYLKPSLTHRQVFTRSSMPRTFFEKVKTARE